MASGSALRQFDRLSRLVLRPRLVAKGFRADRGRIFRRQVELEGWIVTQIVQFQVGLKSLAGRYTANVGVFSNRYRPENRPTLNNLPQVSDCLPAQWKRLGRFYDPPKTFLDSLLRRTESDRPDFWWRQHEDPRRMSESLESVWSCLERGALPWLDSLTREEAFEWAMKELERARIWRASRGNPGAESRFELRYFEPDLGVDSDSSAR